MTDIFPAKPNIGEKMKKHSDEAQDKKLIKKMMSSHEKKEGPKKKIEKHLKEDIKESGKSIRKDTGLIKSMKAYRGR